MGLAVDVASFFGIRQDDAWKNARMILDTVKRLWRPLAEQFGVSRASQNEMAPAFSLCEQETATKKAIVQSAGKE